MLLEVLDASHVYSAFTTKSRFTTTCKNNECYGIFQSIPYMEYFRIHNTLPIIIHVKMPQILDVDYFNMDTTVSLRTRAR